MALSTKVTTEKKTRMYEGKVVRRFMKDKAGPTEYLEVECLKYTPAAPVILEKIPSYEQQDNDVIPIWDVIAGPLIVTPEVQAPTSTYLHIMTSLKVGATEYPSFIQTSHIVLKMDREKLYYDLFPLK